jgi:hypothetical protein
LTCIFVGHCIFSSEGLRKIISDHLTSPDNPRAQTALN